MGLKALYIIEVKTRLIEIGKELDELVKLVNDGAPESRAFFGPQIEEFKERYKELEGDHDLMRMFDESEWGGFADTMDKALHKLRHDVGLALGAIKAPLVPA